MLSKAHSRLPSESVINVSQVLALDRSFLTERVGRVPPREWTMVESGLRLVLGL
jgi:mRNA interferase MazF